mgnify:CR=1 FL=1
MQVPRSEKDSHGARFFSLKWKVGLVVSLVLIVVNSLITLVAYRQSNQQFNEQKFDLLRQQQHTISGLLQRDYEQLTSFASFIPLLSGGEEEAGGAARLQAILARHSALLGLEWGIEFLSFFGPSGINEFNWPQRRGDVDHRRPGTGHRAAAGVEQDAVESQTHQGRPQIVGEGNVGGVAGGVRPVAEGDLEAQLDIRARDEVGLNDVQVDEMKAALEERAAAAAERLLAEGAGTVLVSMGQRGVLVARPGRTGTTGCSNFISGHKVKVRDSNVASSAFIAGLVHHHPVLLAGPRQLEHLDGSPHDDEERGHRQTDPPHIVAILEATPQP